MTQEMGRRRALALSGVVLAGAVAGCSGGDESENGLEDGDVTAIEAWIDDGIAYGRSARFELNTWLEEPDKMSLGDFETVESEGEKLLTRWDVEIEPVRAEIRETAIERTVNENSWTVAGSDLLETMTSVRDTLDALVAGIGLVIEADEPTGLTDEGRSSIESAVTDGRNSINEIQQLWYEGGA